MDKEFLEMALKALSIKEKIDKLDFTKLKKLLLCQTTVKIIKREATGW